MTQYNSVTIKQSDLQYDKSNWPVKNSVSVKLKLSTNMLNINEACFQHSLLLTNQQIAKIYKLGSANREFLRIMWTDLFKDKF